MTSSNKAPDLEPLAAEQVAGYLRGLRIGSPLYIAPTSKLLLILELLIPKILCAEHSEWATESIDGFFLSRRSRPMSDPWSSPEPAS